MVRLLIILVAYICIWIFTPPAFAAQPIVFQEGFESNLVNWEIVSAVVPNTLGVSSQQFFKGSKSLQLNMVDPDAAKYLHIRRSFTSQTNFLARVFFYDTLDNSLGTVFGIRKPGTTETTAIGVKTDVSAVNYIVRNNNAAGMFDSQIPRRLGWNMFEIIVTSGGTYAKINNQLVMINSVPYVNSSQTSSDAVEFVSTWALPGLVYYDELVIVGQDTGVWTEIQKQIVADYYDIYKNTSFAPIYPSLGINIAHSNDLRSLNDTAAAIYLHGRMTNDTSAKNRGIQLLKDALNNGKWSQYNDWARGLMFTLVYATKIMWEDLDETTKQQAFDIISVQTEDYITKNRLPESGHVGDTKAEENAWHAAFLAAAANLFPGIPNVAQVEAKARCFAYHSVTRSTDPSYCGIDTQTVYDDYRLENHSLNNPIYSAAVFHLLSRGALSYELVGKPIPDEFKHNLTGLYPKMLSYVDLGSYHTKGIPLLDWSGLNNSFFYGNAWRYAQKIGVSIGISPQDYFQKRSLFYYKIPNDYIKDPPSSIPYFNQDIKDSDGYRWFLATNNSADIQAVDLFLWKTVPIDYEGCTNLKLNALGQSSISKWKTKTWKGLGLWSCDVQGVRINGLQPTNVELYSNLVPVKGSTNYTVKYYVKAASVSTIGEAQTTGKIFTSQYSNLAQETDDLSVNRLDAGFGLGSSTVGTVDWVEKTYNFTTLSDTRFVRLRASLGGGGTGAATGTLWFDDVSIVDTNTIPVLGDFTGDRKVDLQDLQHIISLWLSPFSINDYNLVVTNWGRQ